MAKRVKERKRVQAASAPVASAPDVCEYDAGGWCSKHQRLRRFHGAITRNINDERTDEINAMDGKERRAWLVAESKAKRAGKIHVSG